MEKYLIILEQIGRIANQQEGVPFQRTSILKGGGQLIMKGKIDREFFLQNYKDQYVVVEDCDTKLKEKMKIEDYFSYQQMEDEYSNFYLKDLKISKKVFSSIFKKNSLNLLVENWLNLLPADIFPNLRWFYIGKKNNYSSFHYDVFNSAAWNILFEGTKAWFFIKTGQLINRSELSNISKQILNGKISNLYNICGCLQEAGDLIYVDSNTPHMVINLTNTTSFTENVVNSYNIDMVIEKTLKYNKEWSLLFSKLKRHVSEQNKKS